MHLLYIYIAAALIAAWGIAHLFATKGVVSGFGKLSEDNRWIITMEWIVEGVALIATGAFVSAAAFVAPASAVAFAVYAVAIANLIVLALVSLFTGFRIAFLPFRLCPIIFGISAALIAYGAWG
jgi:hypothetical protein